MIKESSRNTLKKCHKPLFLNNIFYGLAIFVTSITVSLTPAPCQPAPHIEIIALVENKAMLQIGHERVLISAGETGRHGVKLIAADAHGAELEIAGQRRHYTLGNTIRNTANTQARQAPPANILIYRSPDSMFRTVGSINGYPVNFLVDTGASSVVISSIEARRLGINYKLDGEPIWVSTASRTEQAVRVTVDRITISGVTLTSIDGVVIEGAQPVTPLLGMSFLNRFTISNDGNVMRLKRKY